VAAEEERNIRLFVDADGRLTDLLSRLNIEIDLLSSIRGKARGFGFVEMNVVDIDTPSALTALAKKPEHVMATVQEAETAALPPKHKTKPSNNTRRGKRRPHAISANTLAHAIETFGSEQAARRWLSSECGALNNRTPLQVIQGKAGVTEVDRILSCIDHGIFA
jgi:uncharacterized protein (DUF2384 family)